jgi:glycosyltransferase involved in cell wall biosynthesis
VLEAVRGGTSRHLADIVRYAPGVSHHVAVPPESPSASGGAVYDAAAVARLISDGAEVHRVPMSRGPLEASNAVAVSRIVRLIRHVRPDVVHGHSSVGGAVARVAGALAGVPVAYTPNGVATEKPYQLIERALGPLTWRWIAVSPSEAALAASWGLRGVVTIPNGIPKTPAAEPVSLRGLLDLTAETPLVGTVARLVAQKAPEDFVAICAVLARRFPQVHFVLIGMGPLQAAVSEAIASSGLAGRFHQIEHLPDAASALGDLDVFVLTSRFEGAPYTALEAMAAGVAVVLTDVVGNRDCIVDGESGLLCPPTDIEALSAAVGRLLISPAHRTALGAAGRQRVAAHFDVVEMGRALSELYSS